LDNFEWPYLRNGSRSTYIARIARSSLRDSTAFLFHKQLKIFNRFLHYVPILYAKLQIFIQFFYSVVANFDEVMPY